MSILELHDVTKRHGGSSPVTALRSVSLTLEAGELAAVVGPSGSGKSTLLAIAGTLERPTEGTVRVAGTDVATLHDSQLSALRAHHIGFVFQQFFLVPTLSAVENVSQALLYRGVPPALRRRRAADALESVGLGHRLGHRPSELSGGECQRVAIARALVGEPDLILADEPTGNVDSTQGLEILELLEQLNAAGATVVVVTHDAGIAGRLPRTIKLRDGAIDRDGSA